MQWKFLHLLVYVICFDFLATSIFGYLTTWFICVSSPELIRKLLHQEWLESRNALLC
jgi:hypothetical protein